MYINYAGQISINRHAERWHGNPSSRADVRPFYDSNETVRLARKKCEKQDLTGTRLGLETVTFSNEADAVQSTPSGSQVSKTTKSFDETAPNPLKDNLKLKNCKQKFRLMLTAMKNSHLL